METIIDNIKADKTLTKSRRKHLVSLVYQSVKLIRRGEVPQQLQPYVNTLNNL